MASGWVPLLLVFADLNLSTGKRMQTVTKTVMKSNQTSVDKFNSSGVSEEVKVKNANQDTVDKSQKQQGQRFIASQASQKVEIRNSNREVIGEANESQPKKELLWDLVDTINDVRFFTDKQIQGTIGSRHFGFKNVGMFMFDDDLEKAYTSSLTMYPTLWPKFFFSSYWFKDDGATVVFQQVSQIRTRTIKLSDLPSEVTIQLDLEKQEYDKVTGYFDPGTKILSWAGVLRFNATRMAAETCPTPFFGQVRKLALPVEYIPTREKKTPNKDEWGFTQAYRKGLLYLSYVCAQEGGSSGPVYPQPFKMSLILKMATEAYSTADWGLSNMNWPDKPQSYS